MKSSAFGAVPLTIRFIENGTGGVYLHVSDVISTLKLAQVAKGVTFKTLISDFERLRDQDGS